jgi:hypothetical protein
MDGKKRYIPFNPFHSARQSALLDELLHQLGHFPNGGSMQNISLPLPMQNEIHYLRMRHPCVYILLYYMQNSLVERLTVSHAM